MIISNDCYSETICKEVVFTSDDTTNAISNINLNAIKIYPNPVLTKIYFEENYKEQKYYIYNLLGKVIKTGNIKNNEIEVEDLVSGMYLLTIENENSLHQQKFIKE